MSSRPDVFSRRDESKCHQLLFCLIKMSGQPLPHLPGYLIVLRQDPFSASTVWGITIQPLQSRFKCENTSPQCNQHHRDGARSLFSTLPSLLQCICIAASLSPQILRAALSGTVYPMNDLMAASAIFSTTSRHAAVILYTVGQKVYRKRSGFRNG